jgi:hypothetical protein
MISETREEYMKLEANCGLKVGDKVRATRFPKRYERGWGNYPWFPGVKTFVNIIGVVVSITREGGQGILVEINNIRAHYPYFVLEKVEEISMISVGVPNNNDEGRLKYLNDGGSWMESMNAPDRIINHPDYAFVGSTKHDGRKIYSYYSGHSILYRFKE